MYKILSWAAFPVVILSIICVLVTSNIWLNGLPEGHDYHNQIVSYELFRDQLSSGEFFPRWLKDANSGLGGMNLFYYPIFSYYSAYLVDTLTPDFLSTKHILGMNASLFILLSSFSAYYLFRSFSDKPIAFTGALLYAILPYHLSYDLIIRNALAETCAYIWVPLIFSFIRPEKLIHKHNVIFLAFSYCLLILSHIPSALFFSVFIGAYCLMKLVALDSTKERINYTLSCSFAIFAGLGLSSAFLMPAITMLDYINTEFLWSWFFDYSNWFLFPLSVCHIDAFCEGPRMFAVMQFIIPLILLLFFLFFKDRERSPSITIEIYHYIFLAALCLFLMSVYSDFIWTAIPVLQKAQFPWRLLAVSDFIYVTLLVHIISQRPFKKISSDHKTFVLLVILISFYTAYDTFINATKHGFEVIPNYDQSTLEHAYKSKNTHYEYVPQNKHSHSLSYEEQMNIKKTPLIQTSSNDAIVDLLEHKSRNITLSVNARDNFILSIGQFYLPAWQVIKNDINVTQDVALHSIEPYGQMAMALPAGKYNIELVLPLFVQEKLGLIISLISVLLLALYGFVYARKNPVP